jgi:hypothetical protein
MEWNRWTSAVLGVNAVELKWVGLAFCGKFRQCCDMNSTALAPAIFLLLALL